MIADPRARNVTSVTSTCCAQHDLLCFKLGGSHVEAQHDHRSDRTSARMRRGHRRVGISSDVSVLAVIAGKLAGRITATTVVLLGTARVTADMNHVGKAGVILRHSGNYGFEGCAPTKSGDEVLMIHSSSSRENFTTGIEISTTVQSGYSVSIVYQLAHGQVVFRSEIKHVFSH